MKALTASKWNEKIKKIKKSPNEIKLYIHNNSKSIMYWILQSDYCLYLNVTLACIQVCHFQQFFISQGSLNHLEPRRLRRYPCAKFHKCPPSGSPFPSPLAVNEARVWVYNTVFDQAVACLMWNRSGFNISKLAPSETWEILHKPDKYEPF